MRLIASILFVLLATVGYPQTSIQVTGQVMRPPNDTILVEVFSDGNTIARSSFVGDFYEVQLGQLPHYQIKITSGRKVKYCRINCNLMLVEKIILDVDFSSSYNSEISLEKQSNKYFTLKLYNSKGVRFQEIERTYSQY